MFPYDCLMIDDTDTQRSESVVVLLVRKSPIKDILDGHLDLDSDLRCGIRGLTIFLDTSTVLGVA